MAQVAKLDQRCSPSEVIGAPAGSRVAVGHRSCGVEPPAFRPGEETPLPPFGVSRGILTQITANMFDMAKVVKRAYKYRFYPTPEQAADLTRTFGCARKVYNLALEARTAAWDQRHERVTYLQSSALLTQWKRSGDLLYLNEVSSVPLQQALRHLQSAFARFRDSQARYPRFKSRKKSRASAEYTRSAFRYRDGQLHLAKMTGPLAVVWVVCLGGTIYL